MSNQNHPKSFYHFTVANDFGEEPCVYMGFSLNCPLLPTEVIQKIRFSFMEYRTSLLGDMSLCRLSSDSDDESVQFFVSGTYKDFNISTFSNWDRFVSSISHTFPFGVKVSCVMPIQSNFNERKSLDFLSLLHSVHEHNLLMDEAASTNRSDRRRL